MTPLWRVVAAFGIVSSIGFGFYLGLTRESINWMKYVFFTFPAYAVPLAFLGTERFVQPGGRYAKLWTWGVGVVVIAYLLVMATAPFLSADW